MPKRSAPEPDTDIIAVRTAARRAAGLFAKGIGEDAVLREAAAIFARLNPDLPRRLARSGRELAKAETLARKPLAWCGPVTRVSPPLTLLAALARPARAGDLAATAAEASRRDDPRSARRPDAGRPADAAAEHRRGNLRLVPGGRSAAG